MSRQTASTDRAPATAPNAWPAAGAPTPEPLARPRRGGRKVLIVACVLLLVLVAAGVGALVSRSGQDGSPGGETAGAPTRTSTQPGPDADVRTEEPPPTTEPAAGVIADEPTTTARPPSTTARPPSTSPPQQTATTSVAPSGSASALVDDAHRVSFTLPAAMEEVRAFDGSSARWEYGSLSMDYGVLPGGGVSDADDRYAGLRSTFVGPIPLDTRPPDSVVDGRYLLSGTQSDGTIVYERAKVRCGDLVWYRITAPVGSNADLGLQIPNDLYSETADGDAMGGVHADGC